MIETAMIHTILAQPENPRHEATSRVQAAGRKGLIQTPEAAAQRVLDCLGALRERYDSGAFVDVREM